jgi:peptide methionine sulfoxide reductase msrA/msrB
MKNFLNKMLVLLLLLSTFSNCNNAQNKSNKRNKAVMEDKKDTSSIQQIVLNNDELKKSLDPEVYRVAREKGTEYAFSGKFWNHKEAGTYYCAVCKLPLFKSEGKFESSCGWPSFFEPITKDAIHYYEDNTHGMQRVEVTCGRCESHLGHIFDDGPPPTYKRYCINSVVLNFDDKKVEATAADTSAVAIFGGGCFWCVEAQYQLLKGVNKVESGYAGGSVKNPTYKEVCSGITGHAEVIKITYNPKIISYDELLEAFWLAHDPTTLNRQGNDVGTQYRSIIIYTNEEQKQKAEAYKQKLNAEKVFDNPVVTEIVALSDYYPAESYHQNYYNENGSESYCTFVVRPKVEKFKKVFKEKLK